jgi:hypothetical protein
MARLKPYFDKKKEKLFGISQCLKLEEQLHPEPKPCALCKRSFIYFKSNIRMAESVGEGNQFFIKCVLFERNTLNVIEKMECISWLKFMIAFPIVIIH